MIKKLPDMSVKKDSFLVSGDKCFFSLQGEGPTFGKPAIFLRLHLCNLQCGFCDTPYTWNRKDKRFFSEPERWSIHKTVKEITKFNCKRLVITGGEPLLHKEAIIKLMYVLGDKWEFEIETNGTLLPIEHRAGRDIQYNVSPKIENSGNSYIVRYRPKVLKNFNETRYEATFKFVVTGPKDIPEIEKIIEDCKLDKDKIILMPEGVTQEAIVKHGRAVTDLCKEKGWRLMPRLHIMLWGNKRTK
jgi:organic radical activating enzyme